MTIAEKLKRLTRDMNIAAVSRRVGVTPATFHAYMSGSMPGADKALSIAKALGVSVSWLIDESQGWPPVRIEAEVNELGRKAA